MTLLDGLLLLFFLVVSTCYYQILPFLDLIAGEGQVEHYMINFLYFPATINYTSALPSVTLKNIYSKMDFLGLKRDAKLV